MDKIDFIDEYIEKCSSITCDKLALIEEIVSCFRNEISNIHTGLTSYTRYVDFDGSTDLKILDAKLSNYKFDLLREDKLRDDKLKELELQRQIISITTNNSNESMSISKATAISTVSISQTMKNINKLPEGILNKEESLELKELIHSIDELISSKDNEGAKSKISRVLNTIGNKGFELFIAVAPYLLQAATAVQTTT